MITGGLDWGVLGDGPSVVVMFAEKPFDKGVDTTASWSLCQTEAGGVVLWACSKYIIVCCIMSFLSDSFVDEVEGYIDVPRFCVVVVSNICVDEVEDLVSPRVT